MDFRAIKDCLKAYKEKAGQDESLIQQLQVSKEENLVELKKLLQEKNELVNEMLRLKDEINVLKGQLQEKILREQFFDKEKALLES